MQVDSPTDMSRLTLAGRLPGASEEPGLDAQSPACRTLLRGLLTTASAVIGEVAGEEAWGGSIGWEGRDPKAS